MKKTPNYKLLAIDDNKKPWPMIGNAFISATGSIVVHLDRGVKVTLADGTILESGKLFLRQPSTKSAPATESTAEPAA